MTVVFLATVTSCSLTGMRIHIRAGITAAAGWYALANWVNFAGDLTAWHSWQFSPFTGSAALFFTWLWWKSHRNKRKRIVKLIGAKSRALRDAVVRKLRQLRIPGGVPAPQPES